MTAVGPSPSTSALRSPLVRPISSAAILVSPFANGTPSGPVTSTAAPASKLPDNPVTPTGSNDVPRSTIARCAPASTCSEPVEPTPKAIQSLRAERFASRATIAVPAPGTPAMASASTLSRCAAPITDRIPDHDAIFAADSFEAMPPCDISDADAPAIASRS